MKTVKGIFVALATIVCVVLIGILTWTCLYMAVPQVKDNTDKLFKWNEYKIVELVEETPTLDEISLANFIVRD